MVVRSGEALLVHGVGLSQTPSRSATLSLPPTTVRRYVRDVAEVQIGHEIRRGAVTVDGNGEVVLGLGFMLMGENSHVVTATAMALVSGTEGVAARCKGGGGL